MEKALEIVGGVLKWTVILAWELGKGIWKAVFDDFHL